MLDGENSDESDHEANERKDGELEEDEWGSEREFIRDASHAGFSVHELIRAETLSLENFQSLKFASLDRGAEHVTHPRPLASKITEAVADIRLKRSGKPWRGPLPKARSPYSRQPGQVSVKDLRHSKSGGAAKSSRDLCSQVGKHIDFGSKKDCEHLWLASAQGRTLSRFPSICGLEGLYDGRELKVGSHPAFKAARGLSHLFIARGVPRSLKAGKEVSGGGGSRSTNIFSP